MAVAVVQTRHLRPRGFPAFLGHDCMLVGYRFFVRYHYVKTDMRLAGDADHLRIDSKESGLEIVVDMHDTSAVGLPRGSPFSNWEQARKFLG